MVAAYAEETPRLIECWALLGLTWKFALPVLRLSCHPQLSAAGKIATLPEPIFVFTNSVGDSVTVTQRSTSAFHKYPVGSTVKVYYTASKPQGAEIGDLTLIFLGPVLLIVFGAIGLSFSLLWRLLFLRRMTEGLLNRNSFS